MADSYQFAGIQLDLNLQMCTRSTRIHIQTSHAVRIDNASLDKLAIPAVIREKCLIPDAATGVSSICFRRRPCCLVEEFLPDEGE
jgi:hypothetical protein